MGVVAADAPCAGHQGLMLKPHGLGFFADILVAVKTDLIARFFKYEPVIRGMRFMTFQALAFGYNFMAAAGVFGQHLLVTAAAKLRDIRGQEHFMGRGMRIVTVGTLPGLNRGVNGTAFKGFLKIRVTLQAYFSLGPGF